MTGGPRGAQFAALGLCVAAGLTAIWLPAIPCGTDTPTHIAHAVLLAHPERVAGLAETNFALTSQLFVRLVAPVTLVVPPVVAAKLALSALLLGLTAAAVAITRFARGDDGPGAYVAPAAAVGSFHAMMGFDNFALGVVLGALFAPAMGRAPVAPRRAVGVAALGLLAAHAHIIAFGMCAVWAVIAVAAVATGARDRLREGLRMALALAPGALFALGTVVATWAAQDERGVTEGLGIQRLGLGDQLAQLVVMPFGAWSELGIPLALVCIALVVATAPRLLAASLAGWLALWFLVPFHMPGWAYAQPRLVVPLVLLPAFTAGWGRWPRMTRPLVVALSLLASLGTLAAQLPVASAVRDAVAALGDAPPGRTMTVRTALAPPGAPRWSEPLLHADEWVLLRGGLTADAAALQPVIHSLLPVHGAWPDAPPAFIWRSLVCDTPAACARARETLLDRVAVQGLAYDTVLVVPPDPRDHEALVARGYAAQAEARFAPRPAAIDIAVAGVPPANGRLRIEVAYPQTIGVFAGGELAVAAGLPVAVPRIAPVPAGPCEVRAWFAPDDGATAEIGDAAAAPTAGGVSAIELRPPTWSLPP
jgi:hypothetical protein